MTIDETDNVMKQSQHVSKVQDQSVVLECEALAKAKHLHQSLSKTMQFCHKGKATNDRSKICTNLHALYLEDILTIIDNLKHQLEEEEITLDLQRVQHHDLVKIGCFFGMMEKINVKEWKDHLQKIPSTVLCFKSRISLQTSNTNDG